MRRIVKKIKPWAAQRLEWILLWCFSHLAKYRRCRRPTNQILIARTDGLGDFALWLDAQKQLRALYPKKKLVMILDSTKPTLPWAEQCPDIDEVYYVDVRRYRRFFEVFRMTRRSYDIVIQPVYGRTAFTDLLLFACRADQRITLDGGKRFLTDWEKQVTGRAYDQIVPAAAGVRHELIRCAELIRGLGKPDYLAKLPRCAEAGRRSFAKEPYVAVYPGGSWVEKCWDPIKFAQVCDWIIEQTGYRIYLCGGEGDAPIVEAVYQAMVHAGWADIFAGKSDMVQSVQTISGAAFVFGNDTGAIHIAAVSGVASAAIVADREWGRFFPYEVETTSPDDCFPISIHSDAPCKGCVLEGGEGCRFQEREGSRLLCIERISVEQVKAALADWIDGAMAR